MKSSLSRRAMIGGLLAGAAGPALAGAPATSLVPRPRPLGDATPADTLITRAGLGGQVGFALANLETGELIEARLPDTALPPASVAKAATAAFALERLGSDHRFFTRLIATGPVVNGRVEGDIVLEGAGDPTLDTDALGELAAALKTAGIREATGRLHFDDAALPRIGRIDGDQPDHVGYNPAIGGLNLNFNRVHFEWKRGSAGYEVTMQARARRFRPGVQVARMEIVDRATPVYTYEDREGADRWTVAKGALGREGARWLPVRRPGRYTAEVFLTLARSHGIDLKLGERVTGAEGDLIALWQSPALPEMLADMLDYSTNLTAEALGLKAAETLGPLPETLAASAARMNGWMAARYGLAAPAFADHSGLGYGSLVSAQDMVRILAGAPRIAPLMEEIRVRDDGFAVRAKTGTLNFVSALAGYVTPPGGAPAVFAIFCADTARRDAIPPEQRERPQGARSYANRARTLQKDLIRRWIAEYGA